MWAGGRHRYCTRDFDADVFADTVAQLRRQTSIPIDILFLDCDANILQRRYTESRRVHPMASDRPLVDSIIAERLLLEPLCEAADIVIDSSHTNIHEFADILRSQLANEEVAAPHVQIISFAYRNGVPRDSDLVFDARFLRNPHHDPDLQPLTGHDPVVGAYIENDTDFAVFFERLTDLLALLLPRFQAEGKNYLTIAMGCTGGRHRSVFVAEKLERGSTDRLCLSICGTANCRKAELAAPITKALAGRVIHDQNDIAHPWWVGQ